MPDLYKKAHITQILIAINVIIFFAESFMGGSENQTVALRFGAFYTPYILNLNEWYRLFTSMFLHFGPEHLGTNMLSLLALGPYAEKILGKIPYLLVYLFSGLCGNALTLIAELMTHQVSLSAGASGAICGLMGFIVFFSILPRSRRIFPLKNVGLALLCMIVPGITESSINLYAHIGGAVGGFLMTAIIYGFKRLFNLVHK